MMKKLGSTEMSREQTLGRIEDWLAERLAAGSSTANDTADCMRVFANAGKSLGDAIIYASDLLKHNGTITLLTGHKAKGLEWPVVYHLDPWLIKDDAEQELNLRYVIQTRSLDCYYEVLTEEVRS
jgi:superfamily I DNA/RNA helicase